MTGFSSLPVDDRLKSDLARALETRLPQTILFSGDDEAALAALARVMAAAILCEGNVPRPCGLCRSCRKIDENVHPDLSVIDEGDGELKVDLARRLREETTVLPNDGARRVTVIHHAHNLNTAAQNALLKVLEEPPRYAFFILTTVRPDALLETVRSRCLKFSLSPEGAPTVGDDAAVEALAPYLSALAAGDECAMMQAALPLEKLPRRAVAGLFPVLQTAVRDALFAAEGLENAPLLPALRAQTAELSRTVSIDRLLRLHTLFCTLQERALRNAAAAAMTGALTAEVFTICFHS